MAQSGHLGRCTDTIGHELRLIDNPQAVVVQEPKIDRPLEAVLATRAYPGVASKMAGFSGSRNQSFRHQLKSTRPRWGQRALSARLPISA
jgi:hypothetical protein